jgi:hypothetical protein
VIGWVTPARNNFDDRRKGERSQLRRGALTPLRNLGNLGRREHVSVAEVEALLLGESGDFVDLGVRGAVLRRQAHVGRRREALAAPVSNLPNRGDRAGGSGSAASGPASFFPARTGATSGIKDSG